MSIPSTNNVLEISSFALINDKTSRSSFLFLSPWNNDISSFLFCYQDHHIFLAVIKIKQSYYMNTKLKTFWDGNKVEVKSFYSYQGIADKAKHFVWLLKKLAYSLQ